MEAPGRCAAYGAGGVSAQAVGDQPFSTEQDLPIVPFWLALAGVPGKLPRDAVEDAPVGSVLSPPVERRYFLVRLHGRCSAK